MKKYFFLFAFFVSLAGASVNAQNVGYKMDTLICSSSVDTLKFYPQTSGTTMSTSASSARQFPSPGWINIQITTDSLTGATGGTAVIQTCNVYGTPSEQDWATVASGGSLTINGATRQRLEFEDLSFSARRFRVLFFAPSSTQTTRCRAYWSYKNLPVAPQ